MDAKTVYAISHVRRDREGKRIEVYRAFLPVAGLIAGAQHDITRDNLLNAVRAGKRVVTAVLRNGRWVEGSEVHATARDYVRSDHNDVEVDNLGALPEIEGPLFIRL